MGVKEGWTNFSKSRSHLKILGDSKVTWSKFRDVDPRILGALLPNSIAKTSWHPGSAHRCEIQSLTLREKHRNRTFENKGQGLTVGCKKYKGTGRWTIRSLTVCAPHQILLE